MAKFSAYYRLCPLIDQKTFIGVSDESINGCVIITLGKNMVIRYKLSDQKQVNSWSSRDKLSAPVVYDARSQKYIGVFNKNQICTWEEGCVQLNNLKKIKFAAPIEYVLTNTSSNTPVVVFHNGHIIPLQKALDRRKESFSLQSVLSDDDSICEAQLLTVMGIATVVVFTRNSKEEYSIYLTPLEEGLVGKSNYKMTRKAEDEVNLICYALVNCETCRLLTLWSDGQLFSLELPTPNSEGFPGKCLTTLTSINPRYKAAILPLNSTHLAVYGADKDDEGALLFIFNWQLCVTECKQSFKLYTTPARLWAGGEGSLLMADGQYLLVVPYQLGQQRIVGLVGSQESETKLLPHVSWGTPIKEESDLKACTTSSADKMIRLYFEEGLSQRTISQNLFLPFVDANDLDGLTNLMGSLSDIPEACIIDVLHMCLQNLGKLGYRELLRTTLMLPVTPNVTTLQQLRHKLGISSVLLLLQELVDAMLDSPADPQLIEWATLLLDAFYQQYLLSRDESVIKTLTEMKAVVESKMEEMRMWQQIDSLLLQLQRRQDLPQSTTHNNTCYSIDTITLY